MPQSSVRTADESDLVAPSCGCLAHRFGNAADRPHRRPTYPSDMTDAEWVVVRDLLPEYRFEDAEQGGRCLVLQLLQLADHLGRRDVGAGGSIWPTLM